MITTLDGVTHYADEMTLDENFTHAIARPLLTKLSDGTRFSADSGEYTQNKRTVFDRSIFLLANVIMMRGKPDLGSAPRAAFTMSKTAPYPIRM